MCVSRIAAKFEDFLWLSSSGLCAHLFQSGKISTGTRFVHLGGFSDPVAQNEALASALTACRKAVCHASLHDFSHAENKSQQRHRCPSKTSKTICLSNSNCQHTLCWFSEYFIAEGRGVITSFRKMPFRDLPEHPKFQPPSES
jgi:hypothetical protein